MKRVCGLGRCCRFRVYCLRFRVGIRVACVSALVSLPGVCVLKIQCLSLLRSLKERSIFVEQDAPNSIFSVLYLHIRETLVISDLGGFSLVGGTTISSGASGASAG